MRLYHYLWLGDGALRLLFKGKKIKYEYFL